jgi:alcohol dehydrogenase
MRALVYRGPQDVRCEDVPDPVLPSERGAVVRVESAGICGSDLHIYGGHGFVPHDGYTVGHEAVGVVHEVGSAVSRFSVGDRVLVSASVGCGRCVPCLHGQILRCENPGENGVYGVGMALGGCQAELVAVPAADMNLEHVPSTLGDDTALVLTDNAPTGWFGARVGRIGPGDSVAVIGLGPVGLMAITAAQVMGASQVFGIDLVAERRQQATALGAVAVGDDPVPEIRAATGGKGVDVVVEAVGADATIALGLRLAGPFGRVSVVGVSQNRAFPVDLQLAQVKCLQLSIGLCSVQHELPTLLALSESGRIDPGAIVTHHLPLEDGADAYALFASRAEGVSKVVLDVASA